MNWPIRGDRAAAGEIDEADAQVVVFAIAQDWNAGEIAGQGARWHGGGAGTDLRNGVVVDHDAAATPLRKVKWKPCLFGVGADPVGRYGADGRRSYPQLSAWGGARAVAGGAAEGQASGYVAQGEPRGRSCESNVRAVAQDSER